MKQKVPNLHQENRHKETINRNNKRIRTAGKVRVIRCYSKSLLLQAGSFYTRRKVFPEFGCHGSKYLVSSFFFFFFFLSSYPRARTARLYDMSDLAFVVVHKHAGDGLGNSNLSASNYPNKV